MLSKNEVLKKFNKEDHEEIIKIYGLLELAYEKGVPVFTKEFCTPQIWIYFINNCNFNGFKVEACGYFEECDRKILSFNNIYSSSYPYSVLKITNKSRFTSLTHRDYLGAIMALGIKRDKFGDLRVNENYAILPVYEEVSEYIISNLSTVGKCPIECESISNNQYIETEFLEEIINITSLRLDNLVARLANISRSRSIDYIKESKVLVDYCKVNNKSVEVKEGQRVTISGIGKFIVGNIVGKTKSGKYKVKIKKYI